MSNLSQLRQQHKKTFSIIESLYNDYGNYVRPLSTNEYDADAFDYCNRGYLGERRSKSVQSLLHSCECWQEERTVQFTEEEWIPQITVPKPFQMTLRDEKAPIKASYSQKFIKELTEKKQEEMRESVEATNKLRCKAREVPRSTYEPIYEQMLVDMERAREERHRRAAQMIQRSRRPFSALTTSTTNFHMRRCASAEASEWEKRETFKANEVPMSVYLPPYKDEIQAALRAKARTQRAIKLIQASKAPTGMQERALRAKVQNHIRHNRVCSGESPIPALPPSKTVPDFKLIHQRLADKLEKAPVRPTTIATPFHFESDHRVHAHHCKDDLTTKSRPPRRSFSVSNLSESAAYNVRLNHASLLRNEAIRMRMRKLEDEKNRSRNFWKTVNEENRVSRQRLKQKLAAEEYVNDEIRRKLDEKRKEQMSRTEQYRRELEAMNRRLMGRALILEQQEMLIEKQRFEKKYEESMAKVRAGAKKVTFKESSTREKIDDYGSSTSSSSRKSLQKVEEGTLGDEYNSSFETDTGDVGDSDASDANTATLSDDKLSKISEHSEKTMSSASSSRSTSTA
uniref:Protein FAM161B n=1 Tax=Ascaris suum TaxID=6253 RepID=F1KY29_ASCSU